MNEKFSEAIISQILMGKTSSSLTLCLLLKNVCSSYIPATTFNLIRAQPPHVKQAQQSPLLKIFDNLSGAASEVSLTYCH